MASKAEDKPVAVIKPVEETDEKEVKEHVEVEDSQEDEEEEASDEEEIILDEPSDTEDYVPPEGNEDEGDDDVSCSSSEEEEGVNMEEVKLGGAKLFKLRFEDVEAKRKEYLKMMEEEEKDQAEEEENLQDDSGEVGEDKENQKPSPAFQEYRVFLNETMDDYVPEEDDDFNPIYCGETLSDIEYGDEDERDTDSEVETEPIEGTHKKTGENLMCIKMFEQLSIPPPSTECSPLRSCGETSGENPMECS